MHFLSAPDLKPTQIQPLATEQLIPAVLTRKPATRARLMRALLKGGTLGGACAAFVASWWQAAAH